MKTAYEKLRASDVTRLRELETGLFEAIRRERAERQSRMEERRQKKRKKKKIRRGAR